MKKIRIETFQKYSVLEFWNVSTNIGVDVIVNIIYRPAIHSLPEIEIFSREGGRLDKRQKKRLRKEIIRKIIKRRNKE